MACKKKGFTLVELIIVIFIVGLLSVMIFSLFNIFKKTTGLYEAKSNFMRAGNDSIDFIIEKLFTSEYCISDFKEFNYTGKQIIFKIKEDDPDFNEYAVISFDFLSNKLKYTQILIDNEESEISRNDSVFAQGVEDFNAFFNKGIPEKSNFVYFSMIFVDRSGTLPKSYVFSSGHYLRNVRIK
ncbi:MAG: type II secretion system protein [bacterium]|nr:type II secretion system protein [bacterium]